MPVGKFVTLHSSLDSGRVGEAWQGKGKARLHHLLHTLVIHGTPDV